MSSDTDFVVKIPRVDWNGHAADMRSRLATWEWRFKPHARCDRLVLDFTGVQFMEPWAMVMFGAFALEVRRQGVETAVRFDEDNAANRYLLAMGLGDLITKGDAGTASRMWSESHQNTGLHLLRSYGDLRLFKASADRLMLSHCPDAADALRYAMDEVGRNVLQHSKSQIGGVAIAQHFPDARRLQIAVCDCGVGIRKHIQERNPEIRTDIEGLRLAVLPHASGAMPSGPYGGEQNSGLGLFCAGEIARQAHGSMWIASHRALLGIRGDVATKAEGRAAAPAQPVRVYRTIGLWPGTAVVLDFPTDRVSSLSTILDECSRLAAEARRMAGPAGLDFLSEGSDLEAAHVVRVRDFDGDNEVAMRIRDAEILPRVKGGEPVVLDFDGVRAPAQSFVHALLAEAFATEGSLLRLSFLSCAPSARSVLQMVAAYATYRRVVGN